MERIDYAGSVHDEEEIEAVVSVLRGGSTALRIGKHTREMERLVAESFGKQRGVMVNSGSSALYLAVELLGLSPGDEVLTSALTFSTDIASILRANLVPVLVDVTEDTYQIDVDQIESAIGPRTKAILAPNLIGNCPNWDDIRAIADRHGLQVIEDSCDCLGATLDGRPTGTRSDITVTSFALSHIITAAGTGGMVCLDDPALVDRALMLRRWGRRSEPKFFGSQKGTRTFFSDLDGMEYDDLFIFDEVGWNFEPSEMNAAFGLVQLGKLPQFFEARKRRFELHTDFFSQPHMIERFVPARQLEGLETSWISYPVMVREDAGFSRQQLQRFLESRGIATRMVWSGNILRQPAFKNTPHRAAPGGYPNADRVMRQGIILPMSHAEPLDDLEQIHKAIEDFVAAN